MMKTIVLFLQKPTFRSETISDSCMLYFMLKVLFVLEIFAFFCPDFWLCKKWLDKKVRVNFKIHDITDWTKIITVHIFPNISRSKENQATQPTQRRCKDIVKTS